MVSGYSLTLVRTKADALDDPDPNTTEPAEADVLKLPALRAGGAGIPIQGFRIKLEFGTPGANTATLEIWTRNETVPDGGAFTSRRWALSGTRLLVPSDRMYVQDDTGDGAVYPRLRTITGGNPIKVLAGVA